MRRVLLGLTMIIVVGLLLPAETYAQGSIFVALLDGEQENPPVETPGVGMAVARYDSNSNELVIVVSAFYLEMITASHIHHGARGVNGPIVFDLTGSDFTNPVIRVWRNVPAQYVEALLNGELYVNVHSSNNPGGEIRGQLEFQAIP